MGQGTVDKAPHCCRNRYQRHDQREAQQDLLGGSVPASALTAPALHRTLPEISPERVMPLVGRS